MLVFCCSHFTNALCVCGNVLQTIEALSVIPVPELALRLYLQCAEVQAVYTFLIITKF